MKVASQAGTGEHERQLQLVSPLEQTLDAAVESERHYWALARARAEAEELARLNRVVQLAADRAEANHLRNARDRARSPEGPGARGAPAQPLVHPAAEVQNWVRVCAIGLGLLALLTAFRLPVSPRSRTAVLASAIALPAAQTTPVLAQSVRELRGPGADVSRATLEPVNIEPASRVAALRPSEAHDPARSTLAAAAPRASQPAAHRPEPPRPTATPAAPPAPAAAAHASPQKHADIVTVDDLFGVGGNEPLPPEALEAPTPTPAPPRTTKPAHRGATSSALFYQKLPF
ncbi:MAG TPA: hypothetical protein VFS67_10065 [Polyangiaceae bacterium]|nr:hypothetical protein [Polyangiaceae bacterium]